MGFVQKVPPRFLNIDEDFGNREMARQRNPLFCISKWWDFRQGEGFDGDDDGALEAVCGGRCSVVLPLGQHPPAPSLP